MSRGFGKLPYEKLKGVQVEIFAPCPYDPGQIVCLWKKCRDLAAMLEQADCGFSNLDIHLKNSTSAKWGVDGIPQISVAGDRMRNYPRSDFFTDRSIEHSNITDVDYETVPTAFLRIRNAQAAKVYIPEDVYEPCENHWAYNTETILVQKEAFGTLCDAGDPWNDDCIRREQDQLFMDLDIELDLLPGITANMMRLDRFSSWYTDGFGSESKYEKELERILGTRCLGHYNRNRPKQLQLRYAAMRSFNLGTLFYGYKASKSRDMTTCPSPSTDVRTIQEALALGLIKEEWSRDTWHNGCYPNGIPPFNSHEFVLKLWTSLNGEVLMQYEREFYDKLWKCVGDCDTFPIVGEFFYLQDFLALY